MNLAKMAAVGHGQDQSINTKPAPPAPPALMQQLEDQGALLVTLFEIINHLEGRLDPVIQDGSQLAPPADVNGYRLATDNVGCNNRAIDAATARLRSIGNRLTL